MKKAHNFLKSKELFALANVCAINIQLPVFLLFKRIQEVDK